MNQRLIPIYILSSVFILACGGGEGTGYTTEAPDGCTPGSTQICAGPGACTGAQVCSEDGAFWEECVCGDPGTGGTDPGTGGTITGGSSTDTGGTVSTGGTGGTGGTDTGGSDLQTGGNDVTGGFGTGGFEDPCIPKTCLTIAVELNSGVTDPVPDACGLVNDGCGNIIDCGGCSGGKFCGGGSLNTEYEPFSWGELDDGIDNLCGGGCTSNPNSCQEGFVSIGCSQQDLSMQYVTLKTGLNVYCEYGVVNNGPFCCEAILE